jgi:hypothetical protein
MVFTLNSSSKDLGGMVEGGTPIPPQRDQEVRHTPSVKKPIVSITRLVKFQHIGI